MKRQRSLMTTSEPAHTSQWDSGDEDSELDEERSDSKRNGQNRDSRQRKKRKLAPSDQNSPGSDSPLQGNFVPDFKFSDLIGQDFHVYILKSDLNPNAPSVLNEDIWGSNPYSIDSDPVCVLQHSGLVDIHLKDFPIDMIAVRLTLHIQASPSHLEGSTQGGIKSKSLQTVTQPAVFSALQFQLIYSADSWIISDLKKQQSSSSLSSYSKNHHNQQSPGGNNSSNENYALSHPSSTALDANGNVINSSSSNAMDGIILAAAAAAAAVSTSSTPIQSGSSNVNQSSNNSNYSANNINNNPTINLINTLTVPQPSKISRPASTTGVPHSQSLAPPKRQRASNKHKKQSEEIDTTVSMDVLPDTILQFNLSNEFCFQYNLNLICDRGVDPVQWTSHRFRKAVLMLETVNSRYELSREPSNPANSSSSASMDPNNATPIYDTYRWTKVLNPLTKTRLWHSKHPVPLDSSKDCQLVHSGLDWSQLIWGPSTVTIEGHSYEIKKLFWISRNDTASTVASK